MIPPSLLTELRSLLLISKNLLVHLSVKQDRNITHPTAALSGEEEKLRRRSMHFTSFYIINKIYYFRSYFDYRFPVLKTCVIFGLYVYKFSKRRMHNILIIIFILLLFVILVKTCLESVFNYMNFSYLYVVFKIFK